jgi:hypothetical protein
VRPDMISPVSTVQEPLYAELWRFSVGPLEGVSCNSSDFRSDRGQQRWRMCINGRAKKAVSEREEGGRALTAKDFFQLFSRDTTKPGVSLESTQTARRNTESRDRHLLR